MGQANLRKEIYDPRKPFNEQIRKIVTATHSEDSPIRVLRDGKRFKTEVDLSFLSRHDGSRYVDGIGTKGKLHWEMDSVEGGVRDAIAMVFDDAIESGRIPMEVIDHLILQEEDQGKIFRIINTLSDLCIEHSWSAPNGNTYPVAITAGETAILNTIQGFELGIVAVAYVRNGHTITPNVKPGDLLIGLSSSGVHSNGLSFFREEFLGEREMKLDKMLPWGITLGEELTTPTAIYLPALKALIERFAYGDMPAGRFIHGMVHITGGGLSKLRELIPDRRDLDIKVTRNHGLEPQEIFHFTNREFSVPSDKMYTRFNNGIGYVVAVSRQKETEALETLNGYFKSETIGMVSGGKGQVVIESKYEPITVVY